jgi:hypothetical protein
MQGEPFQPAFNGRFFSGVKSVTSDGGLLSCELNGRLPRAHRTRPDRRASYGLTVAAVAEIVKVMPIATASA